jgi:primosomal protein N' (replication factor Y)
MHVATIIPIARGIPFDMLTYYCPEALAPGTLVSIPFGKQLIIGIVVETTPLAEAKTLIKQASFALKKVKQVLGYLPFFAQAITALQITATHALAPVGAVAGSTIPQFLFEYMQGEKLSDLLATTDAKPKRYTESVIAATTLDRTDQYKRIIRSAFAADESVFFVAPTIRALTMWQERLEKGIQKHIVVLHSKTTKKALRSAFAQIKGSERPLLVFVTPGFFVVPRKDLGVVIAEDESSNLYRTNDRFAIDTRILIREFCTAAGLSLTWGDTIPRLETLKRLERDHFPRSYIPDKLHVVPVEHYRTILPSEVMDLIRHGQKKKYRLFVYTNRKGIAPLSRCADCSTIVTCPTCSLPVILRNRINKNGESERYFVCTHCGDTLPATHICTHCGSWNITPTMIGTESLHAEIASLVGAEHVVAVDDDITPDSATIETLIKEIQSKKFVVVVGTNKVLPYLKGIHYTLIPYIDRILSVPALSTTETVLRLIMECNEKSSEGVIVCTRNADFPLLKQLAGQKLNTIIGEELSLRQELGYPPFGLIVKISMTAPVAHIGAIRERVNEYFEGTDITPIPPRRISVGSMKILMTWIIKAPLSYIEDEGSDIMRFLDSLRFPYKIEQNPERF